MSSAIGMKFGAFQMQDPAGGVIVTKTDVYSPPANDVQADELAETDGALVVKQRFKSKTFTVEGYLRKSTRVELEILLDTFKTAMARKNQAFDLDYAGGIRRYLANAQNVIIADRGLTSVAFSVQFLSADGMGWSVDSETLLGSTPFTLGSTSWTVPLVGSYQVEPTIIINLATATGATSKAVTVANGTSLRGLKVTRTWANGDVLEIDSQKKRVFVNNQPHDFDGQFPVWEPGGAIISYLDDMTSRSATIHGFYTPRWL